MVKILNINRRTFEEIEAGKKFSLIDPEGMTWFGDIRAVDYGPKDYYAVTGTVTSGPSEWVGLDIVVSGQYSGPSLRLMLEYLHNKTRGRQPTDAELSAYIAGAFEPEAFGCQK